MSLMLRSAVFSFSLCLILAGCSQKPPEESSRTESAKPQATQAETKTTSQGTSTAAEKATESQAVAPQQPPGRLSGDQLQHAPAPGEAKSALPSEPARAVPDDATVSTPQPQAASATPDPPEKTESAAPKKMPTPDVFMLRNSPLGAVKFEHKLHQERAANKCEACHHASRPEKPAKAAQQSCFDCHTKPPQSGMKTGRQGAFHNPTAQAGTCIDCHKMQNAQGKKAPTKCMECHKKQNA